MSEKHTCCEPVCSGYHIHSCGKPAKACRDGRHYCGIHDPVAIAERQRKRDEKNRPQREREAFEHRKRQYAGEMFSLLERMDGVGTSVEDWTDVAELVKKVRSGYENS